MKLNDHSFEREKINYNRYYIIVYTSKNHVKCVMVGENIKVFEKI